MSKGIIGPAIGLATGGVGGLLTGLVGGQAMGALKTPKAPTAGPGPTAPTTTDAAQQALLDEQKRAAAAGPGDVTNIGGSQGILTDPNAKYVKGQLLGGA